MDATVLESVHFFSFMQPHHQGEPKGEGEDESTLPLSVPPYFFDVMVEESLPRIVSRGKGVFSKEERFPRFLCASPRRLSLQVLLPPFMLIHISPLLLERVFILIIMQTT